jgi:Fur family ferric uptake transcriptional regulator
MTEFESTEGNLHERLRASGHRLTKQRELVLAAVEKLGHATPDQVHAEVSRTAPTVNLSTVYRALDVLSELGLVRHAHLSDRAPTYHPAAGEEHAHFICRGCGRQVSVSRESMHAALGSVAAEIGFEPDYGHLTVFGWCQTGCHEQARQSSS